MGRDLYLDADQFYELRKGKRNRGRFFEALSRIRKCLATAEDIKLLNSRSQSEQSSGGGSWLSKSVHIFGTNREVRRHNDKALIRDCSATDSRGKKKRTCRAWTHVSLSKQVVSIRMQRLSVQISGHASLARSAHFRKKRSCQMPCACTWVCESCCRRTHAWKSVCSMGQPGKL